MKFEQKNKIVYLFITIFTSYSLIVSIFNALGYGIANSLITNSISLRFLLDSNINSYFIDVALQTVEPSSLFLHLTTLSILVYIAFNIGIGALIGYIFNLIKNKKATS